MALRRIGLVTCLGAALAVCFGGGCSASPGAGGENASSRASEAQTAVAPACQPYVDGVNANCPSDVAGWAALAGSSAESCAGTVVPDGVNLVQGFFCLVGLRQVGQCFSDFNSMVSCEQCAGTPNGDTCGGAYGNDFYACQGGMISKEGACKANQFCDPTQGFQFGVIEPRQCGDCDDDHGQAPHRSYHINEGYCMGATGNAPGWHQCIDNGGANGGGHWVYLPQLDAQHGCNPGTPPPPPAKNPCAHVTGANNGAYCGTSTQGGFDRSQADPDTVYDCANGAVVGSTGCGHACYVNPTPGQPDSCNAPNHNPCAGVPGSANGVYCGSSRQDGFDPNAADQNTLYDCVNGAVASSQFCANGCYVAPAGQSDRCYTNGNPCANVPGYANGLFCGLSTQYGFDPSQADAATVYDCENGKVASSTRCRNRCVVSSSGPDYCE